VRGAGEPGAPLEPLISSSRKAKAKRREPRCEIDTWGTHFVRSAPPSSIYLRGTWRRCKES
jgi:hypothetical protein